MTSVAAPRYWARRSAEGAKGCLWKVAQQRRRWLLRRSFLLSLLTSWLFASGSPNWIREEEPVDFRLSKPDCERPQGVVVRLRYSSFRSNATPRPPTWYNANASLRITPTTAALPSPRRRAFC